MNQKRYYRCTQNMYNENLWTMNIPNCVLYPRMAFIRRFYPEMCRISLSGEKRTYPVEKMKNEKNYPADKLSAG